MSEFNCLKAPQEDYGTLKNYVDGEWVEATTDRSLEVENPATGQIIGKVPLSVPDQGPPRA